MHIGKYNLGPWSRNLDEVSTTYFFSVNRPTTCSEHRQLTLVLGTRLKLNQYSTVSLRRKSEPLREAQR